MSAPVAPTKARRIAVHGLFTAAVLAWMASGTGCATQRALRFLPEEGARGAGVFEAGPFSSAELSALLAAENESAAERFVVRVAPGDAVEGDDATDAAVPPVSGDYRVEGGMLLFEPRFPLAEGVRYRATYRDPGKLSLELTVLVPRQETAATTVVEAVFPTAGVLPENLLKFYLHFSAPMSRGQAWDHVRLLDAAGNAIELPFLEIDEELWDRGMRRLTVLIDPGRIKRGVRPLEEVGPALVDGGSFTLAIDSVWEDAKGNPLARGFRKEFRVGPPDRSAPDPAAWTIAAPPRGTREPVVVRLSEPLDHGLLHSAVGVETADGAAIDGAIEVRDAETTWRFAPAEPWANGDHRLVIATTLEDLAGNSVGRPFEVDVSEPVRRRVDVEVVRLAFRPVERDESSR